MKFLIENLELANKCIVPRIFKMILPSWFAESSSCTTRNTKNLSMFTLLSFKLCSNFEGTSKHFAGFFISYPLTIPEISRALGAMEDFRYQIFFLMIIFFFQTILTLSKLFPLIFQTFPLNEYKLFRFPWLTWFGWLVGEQRLFPTICDQSEPSRTWVGACVPVIVSAGILPSKWRKLHLFFRIPLRNLHLILNFKDVWLLDNHGTFRLWHLIILRENCCQELMLRYEISLFFFIKKLISFLFSFNKINTF